MIGLETCFAIINTVLKDSLAIEKIIQLLAHNPRKILSLQIPVIEEGATADLTLFNPKMKWTLTEKDIQSRSKNTPFTNSEFIGKVTGIVHKGKVHLN